MLNNNKLRRLRNGVFKGLERLKYLYLYSNHIHLVESDVFQDMPDLEFVYLHRNHIKTISPQLFQGLPQLKRLFLYNNSLTSIPTGAFDNMASLERLRLDQNPLHCDCNLKWFADFAKKAQFQVSAVCASPVEAASTPVAALGSMICSEFLSLLIL